MYKLHDKKNALLLIGPTNSCKSKIMHSISNAYPKSNRGTMISSKEFPFETCDGVSIIEHEEFKCTEEVVDLFKRVAEGTIVDCNKKGSSFVMERTPNIWCSNHEVNEFISGCDADAMNNRIFTYRCGLRNGLKGLDKELHPYAWKEIYNNIDELKQIVTK